MQKLFSLVLLTGLLGFNACHSKPTPQPVNNQTSVDSTNIFPVTSFLKAQLRQLDTMPITPLLLTTREGQTDSAWLKRSDLREMALPFLSPEIDSIHMHSLFKESSFLDQTINEYTFSYDPAKKLPDSIHLTHWDVYMNPQTNTIERIYMVKERDSANQNITTQLMWLVNKSYSIRTINQIAGKQPVIKEEKMIWNFD